MTWNLILNADPTTNLGAATKSYDNKFASSSIFESNNFIFGSSGSTFNNTFNISYSVSKVYVPAYVIS